MKAEQAILQLKSCLPTLSPYFSSDLGVVNVSKPSASTVEITTDRAHGLSVNKLVTISGIPVPVSVSSYVETSSLVTLNLASDHDFTLNSEAPLDQNQEVSVYAGEAENRTYILRSVPNRRTLVLIRGDNDPLPDLDDVDVYIQETFPYGYNGLKVVTAVPSATVFRYSTDYDQAVPVGLYDGMRVHTAVRVSGAVDIDTVIASYTKEGEDNLWAFVVLADNTANKDKQNQNDATTTQGRQADFRQKIITGFSVYIFVPNKGEILTKTNGRAGRDVIEDIRRPLFRSILGVDLESELYAQGQGVITYNGDSFVSYNGAVYVHEFQFQQVIEITSKDTAIRDFERAFRDISVIHRNQFSELTTYLSSIDLDDEPL